MELNKKALSQDEQDKIYYKASEALAKKKDANLAKMLARAEELHRKALAELSKDDIYY